MWPTNNIKAISWNITEFLFERSYTNAGTGPQIKYYNTFDYIAWNWHYNNIVRDDWYLDIDK